MEPITGLLMLVSSIGMQFITNNANNQQSQKLAALQRNYQALLARQKTEHSQQLQIQLNELQVEMENQVHLLRMKEIEESHDEIIESIVQGQDIDCWPLNVLPFVIKGKSFGTKIGGGAKTISVHCFLTPSNSAAFNRVLYSELDVKLQSDINTNWSTRSTHPIFYYGGAWRDKNADINHVINCVGQLATELRSMPCIVITPHFENDGIAFQINMWGMGDGERHSADFVFKNADENTKLDEIKFSYNYSIKQKFDKSDFEDFGDDALKELDKFLDTTRDEFSAYLQILIGFITDKYFWSMYGEAPYLPSLVSHKKILVEGQNWILNGVKRLYYVTLKESFNVHSENTSLPHPKYLSTLYTALLPLWNKDELKKVSNVRENFLSHQPIDVLFMEMRSFSVEVIKQLVEGNISDYSEDAIFNFILWNDSIIVGGFCSDSGTLLISDNCNKTVYVLYNPSNYAPEHKDICKIYKFNNDVIMESKFDFTQKESPSIRKRLGDILIKHGHELKNSEKESLPVSSVWGQKESLKDSHEFNLEDLKKYFVTLVNREVVEVETVSEGLSIAKVLEWLNQLDQSNVCANKLYLMKSYVKEYNKYLYAAFLGNDRTTFIQHTELIKCFVCKQESAEMKDLFSDNYLYVIPFEK